MVDVGEGTKRKKTNFAPGYQAAIEAIHEIRETQISVGCGNYSRDLYPFRAIVSAAIDPSLTVEETLAEIERQIQEHRDYGRPIQDAKEGGEA